MWAVSSSLGAIITLLAGVPASVSYAASEDTIRDCLCPTTIYKHEVQLKDANRDSSAVFADCVNDTSVIEVDKSNKWHEALGQILDYIDLSERSGKILLYCPRDANKNTCTNHSYRLDTVIHAFELPIAQEFWLEEDVLTEGGECIRH